VRRIRKYNLTYEILTKQEDFEFFKEKIYIPYISKRYGEEALIDDLEKFWKTSPSPVIMAVKEQGVIVGASLIRKSEESLFLIRLGLLDGNDEYRLHGVIGALYYFGIVEGQKTGCRFFDLGGTRPFLTDGLTKFKIGLGAEFVNELSPQKEYLWMGMNKESEQVKSLFADNPFMHVNKDFMLIKNS
jgi:lipid II:glycine glycyltransferase (peptidoglycan interpeptide bridge formation enzyme)